MVAITPEVAHMTAVGVFAMTFILTLVLFCDLRKHSHDQITSANIGNTAIFSLFSILVLCFFFVVWNSVMYAFWKADTEQDKYFLIGLSKIILELRITTGIINFISVGWFITIKLIDVYKDTFLSINKRIIYSCFALYVLSLLFWWLLLALVYVIGHWQSQFLSKPYQTLLNVTTMLYSISSQIYFILILVLFNVKLFRFISLTLTNNETLSLEINERFQNFIIKQTNLVSLITIAFVIFQIIAYWRWVQSVTDNVVSLLYPVLFTFQQCIWAICIYLTFKINNKYYKTCCKFTHYCCVYSCTKLTKHNAGRSRPGATYSNLDRSMSKIPSYTSSGGRLRLDDRDDDEALNVGHSNVQCTVLQVHCLLDKCAHFQKMFDILSEYHVRDEPQFTNESQITEVLNAFHHLLTYHDSEQDFSLIHSRLNPDDIPRCNYRNCQIYSRHYSRRRRFVNTRKTRMHTDHEAKEDEEKQPFGKECRETSQYSVTDILDKLHAFYYHSYDTFVRIRLPETLVFDNEEDRISCIYKQIKGRKNALDSLTNSKFTSDLKLKEDDMKCDNVYSFGQRFEYEADQVSSPWFVQAKYSTLKQELIDNAICRMDIEEYEVEYSKCSKYMATKQVRKIQCNEEYQGAIRQLAAHHVLALLVYCNCDDFQRRWSETFRQIPANESADSLKRRHSHFYHCSKYLRDLIEYFGSRLIDVRNENKTFYHGVNQMLYFTRTIVHFNAPLSTSTEATVALKFSGDVGVVLALKYSSSTYLLHAKYFNCAFFSDFVNEKECLFVGGVPMMIITDIINVSNGQMYRKYINALNVINCILNGTLETDNRSNYDFSADSIDLCCALLSHQLRKQGKNEVDAFPEYITHLLNRYCMNLNQMMIFWHHLDGMDRLKDLLCENSADFFDVNVVCRLFPHLELIEYHNKTLPRNELKLSVHQTMKDIFSAEMEDEQLKYVVIHHKLSLSSSFKKNVVNESQEWSIFQDESKIVLYKEGNDLNFNVLNLRFNQINQANASKSMLKNLL